MIRVRTCCLASNRSRRSRNLSGPRGVSGGLGGGWDGAVTHVPPVCVA